MMSIIIIAEKINKHKSDTLMFQYVSIVYNMIISQIYYALLKYYYIFIRKDPVTQVTVTSCPLS